MKPILFNTEMVQAILDGRKTQTRRIAKYSAQRVYDFACADGKWYETYDPKNPPSHLIEWYMRMGTVGPCAVGDVLWVREKWNYIAESEDDGFFVYAADRRPPDNPADWKWRPSIHMPKEAARIFLRVKDVRVERLRDIHEKYKPGPGNPVIQEGFDYLCDFIATWENTIKPADRAVYGWDANPWVWAIEFERIQEGIG